MNKDMLTEKMLNEFQFHLMNCLLTWTNKNYDMVRYYINTEIEPLYKDLLSKILFYDEKNAQFVRFDNNILVTPNIVNGNIPSFQCTIHIKNEIITIDRFIKTFKKFFNTIFNDICISELTKYSFTPGVMKFIVDFHYRTYVATVMSNILYNFRNRINGINKFDMCEIMASSAFYNTVWRSIVNCDKGACYEEINNETRFPLKDIFGIEKYIDCEISARTDGKIYLLNCEFYN